MTDQEAVRDLVFRWTGVHPENQIIWRCLARHGAQSDSGFGVYDDRSGRLIADWWDGFRFHFRNTVQNHLKEIGRPA